MYNKIKRFFLNNKKILLTLFIISIITFGYLGLNNIINIDGIQELVLTKKANNDTGFYAYLASGRYGWGILSVLLGTYPAPLFLLVFNSILFSISSVLLCEIFNVKKNFYKILVGLIFISFPYGINMYAYLGHQYAMGVAYFTSILGIYLLVKSKKILDLILPSILLSFAISMYQIYIPFITILMLYISILELNNSKNIKVTIKTIFKYFIVFVISCLIYSITLKLILAITNTSLTTYQGIDNMFNFNLNEALSSFGRTFSKIFTFNSVSYYFPKLLQLLLAIIVFISFVLNVLNIKPKYIPFYLLLIIVLLMSPSILEYVKPNSSYHILTQIGYVVFYSGAVALLLCNLEKYSISKYFNITIFSILLFVGITFIYKDNQASYMAHQVSNMSMNIANRLQMKIEELDEYTIDNKMNIMFLGYSPYWGSPNEDIYYNYETGITTSFLTIGERIVDALNVNGGNYKYLSYKENSELYDEAYKYSENIKKYPAKESVFMFKNIIIVKLN